MEFSEITMGLIMSEMFFCLEYSCQSSELLSIRNSYCLRIGKLYFVFPCSCDPVHVKNMVSWGGEAVGRGRWKEDVQVF
jgi:hypothetical protein